MPQWTVVYVVAYWFVLLPALVVGACLRGDRILRIACAIYCCFVTIGHFGLGRISFYHLEPILMLADLGSLSVLLAIAIQCQRWWAIQAAALQLLSCLGHLAATFYHPSRLGYAMMNGIGSYPVALTLLTAIILTRQKNTGPTSPRVSR